MGHGSRLAGITQLLTSCTFCFVELAHPFPDLARSFLCTNCVAKIHRLGSVPGDLAGFGSWYADQFPVRPASAIQRRCASVIPKAICGFP